MKLLDTLRDFLKLGKRRTVTQDQESRLDAMADKVLESADIPEPEPVKKRGYIPPPPDMPRKVVTQVIAEKEEEQVLLDEEQRIYVSPEAYAKAQPVQPMQEHEEDPKLKKGAPSFFFLRFKR